MPYPMPHHPYKVLNARQKESFNFQKVSAVLADYGFTTILLNDDWGGADFIAQHVDGKLFMKVQLKSRLGFYQRYEGRKIHICFPVKDNWYMYPHDEFSNVVDKLLHFKKTRNWNMKKEYNRPRAPQAILKLLEKWRLQPLADTPPVGV